MSHSESAKKSNHSGAEGVLDPFVLRLQGILDQVNTFLVLVEEDGTLSYWNQPAAEQLGDPKENFSCFHFIQTPVLKIPSVPQDAPLFQMFFVGRRT